MRTRARHQHRRIRDALEDVGLLRAQLQRVTGMQVGGMTVVLERGVTLSQRTVISPAPRYGGISILEGITSRAGAATDSRPAATTRTAAGDSEIVPVSASSLVGNTGFEPVTSTV